MSTVLFKRGDMATMNATPITDGMVFFNEENDRIYMDNGNTRYQYGGDTELVSNPALATISNAFNASVSLNLFIQKTTVVDSKNTALNVTQDYIPLGCKAFKEAIGLTNYESVGDGTISGGLVTLKGETLQGTLSAGSTSLILNSTILTANSLVDIYTDPPMISPTQVATNNTNKTITLTFKKQESAVGVKALVRNI